MARSRNIKPAFFHNEELAELSPITRLAFIGMWTVSDFKGCLEYRSKRLKVQILPYDNSDMDTIVTNLEKARLIRIYSVQGQRYIKIINFERHQNPHKNERAAGSAIPDFVNDDSLPNQNKEMSQDGTKPDFIGTTRADSLLLIPDSLLPITETINTKTPAKTTAPPSGVCPELWLEYLSIRKRKKGGPVTDRVLTGLYREATKANLSLEAALIICVERGWQSFNASWVDDKPKLTVHQQQMQAFARGIGLGRQEPAPFYQHETLHTVNDIPQLEDHDHEQF